MHFVLLYIARNKSTIVNKRSIAYEFYDTYIAMREWFKVIWFNKAWARFDIKVASYQYKGAIMEIKGLSGA